MIIISTENVRQMILSTVIIRSGYSRRGSGWKWGKRDGEISNVRILDGKGKWKSCEKCCLRVITQTTSYYNYGIIIFLCSVK